MESLQVIVIEVCYLPLHMHSDWACIAINTHQMRMQNKLSQMKHIENENNKIVKTIDFSSASKWSKFKFQRRKKKKVATEFPFFVHFKNTFFEEKTLFLAEKFAKSNPIP